jgi:hypothetical protein
LGEEKEEGEVFDVTRTKCDQQPKNVHQKVVVLFMNGSVEEARGCGAFITPNRYITYV